jgi:hypothetical protein
VRLATFVFVLLGLLAAALAAVTARPSGAAVPVTQHLVALHSGRCAGAAGGSATEGTAIVQSLCASGTAAQLWRVTVVANGSMQLAAANSGLCLTVAGASLNDGAAVVQSACAGGANQRWNAQLSSAGNAWSLTAAHSGKCLAVTDGSFVEGASFVQLPCNGAASRLVIRRDPGVTLSSLDPQPIRQWGVVGSGLTVTNPKPYVWDFAEIGNRIYVAGTFTGVQRYGFDPSSTVIPQAYLAAFDRNTGAHIPGFAPVIDRTVYALEVSPGGKLLVGGEFENVNGQPRTGLVMLDPLTGATEASFTTSVSATNRAIVRELVIDRNDVYVGGEFSNVVLNGTPSFVWNAVRLRADSGAFDPAWYPRYSGSVWDLAVDPSRGRVHAVGFFTSVNADPNTTRFATVTESTGATVPGLPQLEFNSTGQQDTVAVAFAGDRIWVAGAEHMVQVLDPLSNARLAFSHTGITCDKFSFAGCSFVAGGDYQTLEVMGDLVMAGCHCFKPSETNANNASWDGRSHYNSVTNSRADQRVAVAYNSSGAVASTFIPGLAKNFYGTWALHMDVNGCLYVGGYYERSTAGDWIGGFGKFCEPVQPARSLTAFTANRAVKLDWQAPDSQLPVTRYRVLRDGVAIGETSGLTFTDSGRTAGAQHTYGVQALDSAGRIAPAVTVAVTVAAADTTAPGTPPNVAGSVSGSSVTITWGQARDDQGVREYLVHRDFQYVTTVPAGQLSFIDANVGNGPRRYEIRARDWAGNTSAPGVASVTVGAPDTTAPSVPTNVAATVNGTSVTITWNAATDNPGGTGIAGYLIHDNFQYLAFVPPGTSYIHQNAANGPHSYQVRAQDRASNNSAPSTAANATVGAPDTTAPSVPTNVAATVNGTSVTITWNASTDNPGGTGIAGYLIHDNYQYLAWVPAGTSYIHQNAAPGAHSYQVRAQDRASNNSAPTAAVGVTVQ